MLQFALLSAQLLISYSILDGLHICEKPACNMKHMSHSAKLNSLESGCTAGCYTAHWLQHALSGIDQTK